MTIYAKFISETAVQYPTDADFIGIPNWRAHEPALRSKEFFPLVDVPEDREGYRTVLDRFSLTRQTETVPKTVQVLEEIEEIDPETGESHKTGRFHYVIKENVPTEVDASYISVLASHYEELSPPEPEPQPDTTARDNAEKAIVAAIKALADKYDAVAEIALLMYDGSLTIPALMELAGTKGVPEAELGALITELTPYKWQLEAVTGLLWANAWEGLKSRFPEYWSELILDQMEK